MISKKNPNLEIITSAKKFVDTNKNTNLQLMFDIDVLATNIYTLAYRNNSLANLDFTKKLIS